MNSKLIFVYGTLKSSYGNNRLITSSPDSRFVTSAKTQEDMFFYNSGIPFMIRSPILTRAYYDTGDLDYNIEPYQEYGEHRDKLAPVIGELWEINNQSVMDRMDALEGHPNFYRREPLTVLDFITGKPYDCEAYFYHNSTRLTKPNHSIGDNHYHIYHRG